jgi:hypothetical protein
MKKLIAIIIPLFLLVALFQFRKPLWALIPHPKPDPQVAIIFASFGQTQVTPQTITVIDPSGTSVSAPATHGFAIFQLKKQTHYVVVLTSMFQKAVAGFNIPANIPDGGTPIDASLFITDQPSVTRLAPHTDQ